MILEQVRALNERLRRLDDELVATLQHLGARLGSPAQAVYYLRGDGIGLSIPNGADPSGYTPVVFRNGRFYFLDGTPVP